MYVCVKCGVHVCDVYMWGVLCWVCVYVRSARMVCVTRVPWQRHTYGTCSTHRCEVHASHSDRLWFVSTFTLVVNDSELDDCGQHHLRQWHRAASKSHGRN